MKRTARGRLAWYALMRRARSYFTKEVVLRRSSRFHPLLEVVALNGRMLLNGATVNYSFGSLHRVFEEAFEQLDVAARRIDTALLLGLGGGSVVEILLRGAHPPRAITAVEIDPVVVDLARTHFGLDLHAGLEVVTADATTYVESTAARFDLVVVDVFFEDQVPAACQTPRFLRALGQRVAPGGLLVFNRIAHTPLERTRSAEFLRVFRAVLGDAQTLTVRDNLLCVHRAPRAESGADA